MHLSKKDIQELRKVKRLNIINSVSGIKPANLIGTISESGETNVAIFSSLVHLGSDPAILGFILRPQGKVPRNTYENIQENGMYTINHVHKSFTQQAHYTSAKFDKGVSEFEKCQFTEEYLEDFKAPFVKESAIKIGMKFVEELPIKINGTTLIIGEIQHLFLPDDLMTEEGYINLTDAGTAGIGGLNNYYELNYKEKHPFARPNELPDFKA